jgi:putative acetyltransferase
MLKYTQVMSEPLVIRPEQPVDYAHIHTLLAKAFANESVAEMVALIRRSPHYIPDLALVGQLGDTVVGYVMQSHVRMDDDGRQYEVLCMAPVAVLPEYQKRGIGSQMVRTAIQAAEAHGALLIVLEGSPKYYPRFGFRYSVPYGITHDLPAWAPAEASMVYLLPTYDPRIKGRVVYPPAFAVAA